MRIQFNTGRGYSPMGQPITAIQYDDCVKFRDHAAGTSAGAKLSSYWTSSMGIGATAGLSMSMQ